jgi:hypothetical protein
MATREATAIPPWGISSRKAVTTTIQETTRTETTETTTGTIPEAAIDIIAGDNKLAKRGIQDGIRGSEITNIRRTEIGDDRAQAHGNQRGFVWCSGQERYFRRGRRGSGTKEIRRTVTWRTGLENRDKLNSGGFRDLGIHCGGFFARITGAIDGDFKLVDRQFDKEIFDGG